MKLSIFLILPVLISLSLSSGAQTAGDAKTVTKKAWSSNYRKQFLADCTAEAKKGMSLDSARFYCYCISEKIEAAYPDTANIPIDEIQESAVWKKEVIACLTSIGKWTSEDRIEFMNNCIETATPGLGKKAATNYCECMQYKMEKKIPDPNDLTKITDEILQTPEWQKLIKSCLEKD